MKFAIIGDLHLHQRVPSCRKPEIFYKLQFYKLNYILKKASIEGATKIFFLGDIFQTHTPALSLLLDFIRVLMRFKLEFKLEYYTIIGNHDIEGRNLETYKKSALGLLEGIRLLKIAKDGEIVSVSDLPIKFLNFKEVDKVTPHEFIGLDGCVILCHLMICETKGPFECLVPEQIKTNAKIVICGHYHHPFSRFVNGTLFIAPGVIVRTSITEREIQPSFLLLETGNPLKMQRIKINKIPEGTFIEPTAEVIISSNISNFDLELDSKVLNPEEIVIEAVKKAKNLTNDTKKVILEVIEKIKKEEEIYN